MSAADLLVAHAPKAPERLHSRIAELAPAPRNRRALVLVPVAVALAVGAAIVHGIVGSGGQKAAVHGGLAQIKAAPAVGAGAATSVAPRIFVPGSNSSRLQHTEASLQITVPTARLQSATTAATRIATSLGGYAQSVNYQTPIDGGGEAFIELRVPAQNVKIALARIGALGTLVSQQLSVTDLQHDFDLENAQIAQLRQSVAAYEKALRDPSLPDAQRVILEIRLANARTALAERLHARGSTVASGTTARISLTIATKRSIVVPVTHHRGRLGRMLHGALGFLGLEGMIVVYALVVLSPLLVIAAAWRLKRRRDERLVME